MARSLLVVAAALVACGDNRAGPPADARDVACDPLVQATCPAGEKCAWVQDLAPTATTLGVGHAACVPDGDRAEGEACAYANPDGTGSSSCVRGTECVAGTCRTICDPRATAEPCDDDHACAAYAGLFENAAGIAAGVCDVRCDPLTQRANVGAAREACGSPDPARPTAGCYRSGLDFTCAPHALPGRCSLTTSQRCVVGIAGRCPPGETCELDPAGLRTDRVPALAPGAASAYTNGCAPGYVPFFIERTGSTTIICAGLCAPRKTDATLAANVIGDPGVPAKLPLEAAPAAGNAVCAAGKKGSVPLAPAAEQQNCLYLWPFNFASHGLVANPFNDTLGVCFDFRQYQYDDDGDSTTPRVPVPSCAALPPKGFATNCTCNANGFGCTGTGCPDGQAHEWGCYSTTDTGISLGFGATAAPPVRGPLRDVRIGEYGRGIGVRHRLVP